MSRMFLLSVRSPCTYLNLRLIGRPNRVRLHHSEIHLGAPSRRQDLLLNFQGPDDSLAGIPSAAGRGNAPTTPARSSPLKHTPERGAAREFPSASAPRVGTATRVAQWRKRGLLKSRPPASCSRPLSPSRVVSSIAR